ncbi:MAG: GWxTD domain-containing protein [Saprospiraceae bacterium]|nr:GWxTD domain-containing protein [Saprospiraceae bacterium]
MRTLYIALAFMFIVPQSKALQVSVHTQQFFAGDKPFLDVGFRILAPGITFTESGSGNFSASASVTMIITRTLDQSIVAWEKYKLNAGPLPEKKDLIDQRRFAVPPGIYLLKLEIVDDYDNRNSFGIEKAIDIFALQPPAFSSLMLLTSVEKKQEGPFVYNGLYLEPFAFDVVNETQQVLNYYVEFYPASVMIEDTTAFKVFRFSVKEGFEENDTAKVALVKYKRIRMAVVVPILGAFDLSRLPSGNYHIEVALVNEQKVKLFGVSSAFINRNFPADVAQKRDFNRYFANSFVNDMDSATLIMSLQSLAPLISNEKASALSYVLSKDGNAEMRKYFLYDYWKSAYPSSPQGSYEGYMKVVKAVDQQFFSTLGRGYQTDRAYVFLKYGKPNKVINVEDEANTPPYEIWYYDFLPRTSQTNVRFIFYSPMLANEFELLHTTCYGERKNAQWEITLYKNARGEAIGSGVDATRMSENWNRKARKLFEEQ